MVNNAIEFIDFTVSYIQKHGFSLPLFFPDKVGLDIKVPKSDFTINDVRQCVGKFLKHHVDHWKEQQIYLLMFVGSRRMVDVMDVATQRNLEMTMKEWQQYYENPNKDRLLNVISLEFSHTKLEHYVSAPRTVEFQFIYMFLRMLISLTTSFKLVTGPFD